MLSAFYSFPYARSCGGGTSVGGSSSYDFMGDPAVNMDMSSYDDFVRDSLENQRMVVTAQVLPKSPEKGTNSKPLSINNSSIGHNDSSHTSLNLSKAGAGIKGMGNTTFANRIVILGASGKQDDKTLSWTQLTLSNNMF